MGEDLLVVFLYISHFFHEKYLSLLTLRPTNLLSNMLYLLNFPNIILPFIRYNGHLKPIFHCNSNPFALV